jgi:SAM-dependent methyltransferase
MEPTEHNRRVWDEIHRRRAETSADRLGLWPQARPYLGEVADKHVLQLQCATGEATAELIALGALVTGVDSSTEALAVARERAPTAALVVGDVQDLPIQLRRSRFDLVYSGEGVTPWLHDLDAWAHGIEAALRPGGRLVLHDAHPVAACVDGFLHWREDYFDEAIAESAGWTHFDLAGKPAQEEKQERHWTLGHIVNAVVAARLVLHSLAEFPAERGWRGHDQRVPGSFLVVAEKPR